MRSLSCGTSGRVLALRWCVWADVVEGVCNERQRARPETNYRRATALIWANECDMLDGKALSHLQVSSRRKKLREMVMVMINLRFLVSEKQ